MGREGRGRESFHVGLERLLALQVAQLRELGLPALQPMMQMGLPTMQAGQAALQAGQPMMQMGLPTMQAGQAALQAGQPMMQMGLPTMQTALPTPASAGDETGRGEHANGEAAAARRPPS